MSKRIKIDITLDARRKAQMFRICWKETNGTSGNGEFGLSYECAHDWLTHLRRKYPDMKHWLEKQKSSS